MSSAITPNLDSISLYHKGRELHLNIIGNEEEGFRVQYRQGKKGSNQEPHFKNPTPVDYTMARQIFEMMRDSKLREEWTIL